MLCNAMLSLPTGNDELMSFQRNEGWLRFDFSLFLFLFFFSLFVFLFFSLEAEVFCRVALLGLFTKLSIVVEHFLCDSGLNGMNCLVEMTGGDPKSVLLLFTNRQETSFTTASSNLSP